MIAQRFFPIKALLIPLQKQCVAVCGEYLDQQYDLDSRDLSKYIVASENLLLNTLEALSMITEEKKVMARLQQLGPERCFLLHAAIQFAFIHYHADTEMLPLFPLSQHYPLAFAYLQDCYLSFKQHCQRHGLDIWDQVLTYEWDQHLLSKK